MTLYMKRISEAVTAIGSMIAVVSVCCLDSPGAYGCFAGLVCILGGFIAGTGYAIKVLGEYRKAKHSFCRFLRQDRLDTDVECIEEQKNGTPDSLARTGAVE